MSAISNRISLLTVTIASVLAYSLPTDSTLAHPAPQANLPIKISQSFKAPSHGTAPPSAGGATRSASCLRGSKLTSLTPQNRLGLTSSGHPTFHWYVPQSPAKTAKFLLLSNNDTEVVYETTLSLPNQSGIISFTLPANVSPLAVNQQYHWYLVVGCSQTNQSANPSVEGWVERVQLEDAISAQLQKAEPHEQVRIYANSGIWHEAVSTLIKLRQANPKDSGLVAGWNELLKSVELQAIASEPLLNVTLSQN